MCECDEGYYGDVCEYKAPEKCIKNCLNGGACIKGWLQDHSDETCDCSDTTFTGEYCQTSNITVSFHTISHKLWLIIFTQPCNLDGYGKSPCQNGCGCEVLVDKSISACESCNYRCFNQNDNLFFGKHCEYNPAILNCGSRSISLSIDSDVIDSWYHGPGLGGATVYNGCEHGDYEAECALTNAVDSYSTGEDIYQTIPE